MTRGEGGSETAPLTTECITHSLAETFPRRAPVDTLIHLCTLLPPVSVHSTAHPSSEYTRAWHQITYMVPQVHRPVHPRARVLAQDCHVSRGRSVLHFCPCHSSSTLQVFLVSLFYLAIVVLYLELVQCVVHTRQPANSFTDTCFIVEANTGNRFLRRNENGFRSRTVYSFSRKKFFSH